MAVPKKKTSSCKKRMRSAHKHVNIDTMVPCEACGDWRRPHHLCTHCGSYKGRTVIIPRAVQRQRAAQQADNAGKL